MKQVMNYNKDNGLLNMIRRTDPMIVIIPMVVLLVVSTLIQVSRNTSSEARSLTDPTASTGTTSRLASMIPLFLHGTW